MRKQRIGFAAHSFHDAERTLALGANMVEFKLEKLAKRGEAPYCMDSFKFKLNEKNVRRMIQLKRKYKAQIQFHLPVERCVDLTLETGINIAFPEHHEIALERMRFHEWIYRERDQIGVVNTMHPPAILYNGAYVVSEPEALRNMETFIINWDKIRIQERHKTLIGFENMTSMKYKSGNIGCKVEHFKMFRKVQTLGITVDPGHRLLTGYGENEKEFRVTKLLGLGIDVENIHFHGIYNPKFSPIDWRDDEHNFPNEDNVKGYHNYLSYMRRHRVPVVLEIANLHKRTDQEVSDAINDLKRKLT
ncbi:hypothetical protein ACFL2R_02370 [Patescibacteria group bacterium]